MNHQPNPVLPRVHMGLTVQNLEASIPFYAALFGQEPVKLRPSYAKFSIPAPAINLTLNEVADARMNHGPASHFGVEVDSTTVVKAWTERLKAAGLVTDVEEHVACCYALQDKVWVSDPDGHRWEVFTVLADAQVNTPKKSEAGSDCCPDAQENVEAGENCCDKDAACCA